MRYILIFFIAFVLITTNVYAENIEETKNINKIEEPDVKAIGAVLMDAKTGRILWGKDEYKPLSNASTTKIMTLIVTLENADLNDTVTISKKASLAPKVKMGLSEGEKIKLEYLVYALMLQSSNDAAVAIAEYVGGDEATFCQMMTDKAKELGAKDTLFETPNGLDKGNHHSTAYDMALITRYGLENEKFIEITNTQSVSATSDKRSYEISNKNKLLKEYEGANGVKTGFTNKAGQCFVGAAKRDDMQLISVALGSGWGDTGKKQKWIDSKEMLDYGFDNYEYYEILTSGTTAGDLIITRSKIENLPLYFEDGLMLPLNPIEKENIKIEIDKLETIQAPVQDNQVMGTAKIYINDELIKEVNILCDGSATRHDLKTSLEKVINSWLGIGTNSTVNILLPEF